MKRLLHLNNEQKLLPWVFWVFIFFKILSPPLPVSLMVESLPFHRMQRQQWHTILLDIPLQWSQSSKAFLSHSTQQCEGHECCRQQTQGHRWQMMELWGKEQIGSLPGPVPDILSKFTMHCRQAPHHLWKARSNHSWKEYGKETFLSSNSWIYLAWWLVMALDITTSSYLDNISWIMFRLLVVYSSGDMLSEGLRYAEAKIREDAVISQNWTPTLLVRECWLGSQLPDIQVEVGFCWGKRVTKAQIFP